MYSRCPHCNKQLKVSARQLRINRGLLKCKRCGQSFDALSTLSEKENEFVKPTQDFDWAYDKGKQTSSPMIWTIGSGVMGILLFAQVAYFDGLRLYGQPAIHAALSKACQAFNCRLPMVVNPDDWAVSHSDLQPQLADRYWLTAALTNQAQIFQAYPRLKLTLMDFNGDSLAERIFMPHQYTEQSVLAANETVEIRIPLVIAADDVGGFILTTL